MYILLEFKEQALADYLNLALRRHGVDCYVFTVGVAPDGTAVHCVACLQPSEVDQARHLIYSSRDFIQNMPPEAAEHLREVRRENTRVFLSVFSSKWVLMVSGFLLVVAALGYWFDV
jgi:hypothetical protein